MEQLLYRLQLTLRLIVSYLLRGFSYFVPKKHGLWVFVGWHRSSDGEVFADNAKYMFLEAQKDTDIRAVWIAHDHRLTSILSNHGLDVYYENSFMGIITAMRAEVTFLDSHFDIHNWRTATGSTVVQLWHGKGFKKIAKATHVKKLNSWFHPYVDATYDYVVASSSYTAEMMKDSFRVKDEQMLITGLPRDDVLFRDVPGADVDVHPELRRIVDSTQQSEKLILYAPTFRRYDYDPLACLDDPDLEQYLHRHNATLVVSMHPKFRTRQWQRDNMNPRIVFISPGYDIYPFISSFDSIITDYGSLFLEFLHIDKHCVFLIPDIAEFKANTGLYDDYEYLTPGPKVHTMSEVCQALDASDGLREARARARQTLFAYNDGYAAERIRQWLKAK